MRARAAPRAALAAGADRDQRPGRSRAHPAGAHGRSGGLAPLRAARRGLHGRCGAGPAHPGRPRGSRAAGGRGRSAGADQDRSAAGARQGGRWRHRPGPAGRRAHQSRCVRRPGACRADRRAAGTDAQAAAPGAGVRPGPGVPAAGFARRRPGRRDRAGPCRRHRLLRAGARHAAAAGGFFSLARHGGRHAGRGPAARQGTGLHCGRSRPPAAGPWRAASVPPARAAARLAFGRHPHAPGLHHPGVDGEALSDTLDILVRRHARAAPA